MIHEESQDLLTLISECVNENQNLIHIKEAVEKISEMDKALHYLKLIKSVQDLK